MSDDGPCTVRWGTEAVDPGEKTLPSLKIAYLLAHIPDHGTVLEIGSGEGKILKTLATHRPGLDLHGCDVRDPATAPDHYAFHRLEQDLPLPDQGCDVVLIFDVLEHVPDPAHTLSEAARVLRPDGKLIACIPVEGQRLSFYSLYRRLFGRDLYAQTKEHIQAFTHPGLRQLIESAFDIGDVRYLYHFLGQFMDATFFALMKAKPLQRFWWQDNVCYNPGKSDVSAWSSTLNRLLQAGNTVAWRESTALANVRFGSAAVLVQAKVRPRSPTA
jgi:ubiquinone/menaquinone biosynthesis C-methylase UbiE